jgi:polyisoprenoid-binding protein YceI
MKPLLPFAAATVMIVTACSAPAIATPPAAPPTTAAQPTTPSQPTTASQQTTASQLSTPAQPTATAQTAAAAQDPAQVRLVVDQHSSNASYHAREQLLGKNLPSDAVGTTQQVSGTIVLGPGGEPVADQSKITVDLSTLQSDERRRDNFIKTDTLQTNRFPTATFIARETQGLPVPLPTSGQATFQLSGDLTVHGVTRPVTWQVTATFDQQKVSGNATTQVHITDFGMTPPKAGPVLSIEDQLTLELNFTASRDA